MKLNPIDLSKGKCLWGIRPELSRCLISYNPFLEFIVLRLSTYKWRDGSRFVIWFVGNQPPLSYEKDFTVRFRVPIRNGFDIEGSKTEIPRVSFRNGARVQKFV